MNDYADYKQFLNNEITIDKTTRSILILLARTHPAIENAAPVQKLLKDKNADIPFFEIVRINDNILQRSLHLAKSMHSEAAETRLSMIAEQNVLTLASVMINSAITARYQAALEQINTRMKVKTPC